MKIIYKDSARVYTHIISGSSIKSLWRLLADNKFRIELLFLPKLLLSIPIVLLSMPFALLESILYYSKIKKARIKQPVFILGYPRSGTTYLFYLLSEDPQFAFCRMYECMGPHVMFTFGKVLRLIASGALPRKRPMDNLEMGADLPKEEEFALGNIGLESMANALFFPKKFSEYFDRFVLFKGNKNAEINFTNNMHWFLQKLTIKNNGRQLLMKSPFNTGRVKLLLKMYPDAKFIHIHRHPFDVYSSNEKLYESVLPQVAFHKVSDAEMQKHVLYTYKATMETYFQDKMLLTESNLFELGYSDFIADPIAHLQSAYKQLGINNFEYALPHFEKKVAGYANYTTNKHVNDIAKRAMIYEEWRFSFDRLGYN